MKKDEKKLEDWQYEDAYRLRILIKNYIAEHNINQADFMDMVGMTQGMHFQLCGSEKAPPKRPLSFDHILIFANLLKVPIDKISPTLNRKANEISKIMTLLEDKKEATL